MNRGVDEAVRGLEHLRRAKDSVRFKIRHRKYERSTLDEIQVYRDVQVVGDRRRVKGKRPKVRFFTPEEQRD